MKMKKCLFTELYIKMAKSMQMCRSVLAMNKSLLQPFFLSSGRWLSTNISKHADGIVEMIDTKFPDKTFVYSDADVIKYALSIGAQINQDFQYVYENHPDFSVYPTFPNSLAVTVTLDLIKKGLPGGEKLGLKKGLHDLLHGDEYVELYHPIPTCGALTFRTCIVDIIYKNKFWKVTFENMIYNGKELKIGKILSSFLFMNSKRSSKFANKDSTNSQQTINLNIASVFPPDREPDFIYEQQTSHNQAAVYRLTGDSNPLHVDPTAALEMGFKRPILHGLCSYGFALQHVMKKYANNESTLFKAMKTQFSKPVYPGDTLITEMWKEQTRIIFQMKVKENSGIVLKGGFVDLNI